MAKSDILRDEDGNVVDAAPITSLGESHLPAPHTIKRIAYNAVNADIRGKVVSIVGVRGATHWDGTRVIVRLVEDDGSLGQEYLVTPGLLINL